MINVIYNVEFFKALFALPTSVGKIFLEKFKQFQENPKSDSLKCERLDKLKEKKYWSFRVSDDIRVIFAQGDNNTFYFLYIDHHDAAYKWASRRSFDINRLIGAPNVIFIPEILIDAPKKDVLFSRYTDQELLEIGVPQQLIPILRKVDNMDELSNFLKYIGNDICYEAIYALVSGTKYNDVLEYVKELSKETNSLNDELLESQNVSLSNSFAVLNDKELEKMIDEPLSLWRVFLHPMQKKVAFKDYSGSYKVSGEAGTGKTVVAIHRAKYLIKKGNSVLFTTFTKNLVGDIEKNIQSILDLKEVQNSKLDVKNIDAVICEFLANEGFNRKILYKSEDIDPYWNEAIRTANNDLKFEVDFYKEEWEKVATLLEEIDVDNYISISRVGRNIRLDRVQRFKVWNVFEDYIRLLEKDNVADIDYATYIARNKLKEKNGESLYDSIIIDEGQDISSNEYKFLRLLAGKEHENDLFIVGDYHQRIYKNKAVLSKCGINIVGRSSTLKINYRTTEETRKFAYDFVSDLPIDSEENVSSMKSMSLTRGDAPEVKTFNDINEQISYIQEQIQKLGNEIKFKNEICIVCRQNNKVKTLAKKLDELSIDFYEINGDNVDDGKSGIRLSTMHRVKGLEFRYVFVLDSKNNFNMIREKKANLTENEMIEKSLYYVALTRAQKKAYILLTK